MQTVNGKLVVEPPELDGLKGNIKNLGHQFQHLEGQITVMSEKDKAEYLKQIAYVHLSLQKLERTYRLLLTTIILLAVGLTSWYVWQSFNHHPSPAKQPQLKAAIAPNKLAAKH